MPYPFKYTLVIGATSGIGAALADTILHETSGKVIGAGRRKERLDKWVGEHGTERTSGEVVDLTDLGSLEGFAKRVIAAHPELDCVILNSGISNTLDFTKPETIDIKDIDTELKTNYISYLHLVKYFLPHLQANKRPSCIAGVSSGLGGQRSARCWQRSSCESRSTALTPYVRGPTYSATKAALHSLLTSLRSQLHQGGFEHIKVVEILPPLVQTDLKGTTGEADTSHGMPLAEFTSKTWDRLSAGDEVIPIGQSKDWWDYFGERGQKAFEHLVLAMSGKQATPPWVEEKA